MKKAIYYILILAEAIVDFLAVSLAWTNLGWLPCVITIVVWAVLLAWQILLLTKATDAESKRKICKKIPLVMLVPLLGFVMMFIYWFIDLANAI